MNTRGMTGAQRRVLALLAEHGVPLPLSNATSEAAGCVHSDTAQRLSVRGWVRIWNTDNRATITEQGRQALAVHNLFRAAAAVSLAWDAYIGIDRDGHDDAVVMGQSIAELRAALDIPDVP